MRHNRAKLQLVVPEWVKERSRGTIECIYSDDLTDYASIEEYIRAHPDMQQAMDQLHEAFGPNYEKLDLGKLGIKPSSGIADPLLPDSDALQPIPNVPHDFKPDFEARPYSPDIDGPPKLDLLPWKPDADAPTIKGPNGLRPEDFENGKPQDPAQKAIEDYINSLIRDRGRDFGSIADQFGEDTELKLPKEFDSIIDAMRGRFDKGPGEPGSSTSKPRTIRLPDISEPDEKRPERKPRPKDGPDNGSGIDQTPQSPKEHDAAPKRGWQEILPTVKSGCEAMIKLAEIGSEIQKQLAQVLDRNGERGGMILMRSNEQAHANELGQAPTSSREDDFKRDYDNFLARSAAREQAARRPIRRRI